MKFWFHSIEEPLIHNISLNLRKIFYYDQVIKILIYCVLKVNFNEPYFIKKLRKTHIFSKPLRKSLILFEKN